MDDEEAWIVALKRDAVAALKDKTLREVPALRESMFTSCTAVMQVWGWLGVTLTVCRSLKDPKGPENQFLNPRDW